MMRNLKFNITVASWPGTGSTTLALLLSYIYDMKYFYTGAIFRYFSEKLGYSAEGKKYSRNEDKYGNYLDTLVDDYSEHVLDEGGYVINTKPLGFLINRTDTFDIFLHADIDVRAERAFKDGRESKSTIKESLLIRQEVAGKRYRKLYGIDWEDIEAMKEKHSLVIDTSNLSIPEEIELVVDQVSKKHAINPSKNFDFDNLSPKEIKEKAEKLIKEENRELTTRKAISNIYRHFRGRVELKPPQIRKIFEEALLD